MVEIGHSYKYILNVKVSDKYIMHRFWTGFMQKRLSKYEA
jgi:hypothetical protein